MVRTPTGRILVLTAWHCVEDLPKRKYSLGFTDERSGIWDPFEDVIRGPEPCDVALATLHSESENALKDSPAVIEADMIATPDDDGVGEQDWCVLGGFPSLFVREHVDHGAKVITQMPGAITYAGCTATNRDQRGRYAVTWTEEAEVASIHPDVARQDDIRAGDTNKMPHPAGMSGGPLWRFRRASAPTGVWMPDKRLKIIGVAVSFLESKRIEFVESVSAWGEWFHAQVADIKAR